MKQSKIAMSALVFSLALVTLTYAEKKEGDKKVGPALKFTMETLGGEKVDLAKYQGKVVMMVNVASQCGLTPQYEGLQELHEKYAEKGLAVLGFPANEFGKQEPGSNKEISEFCKANYGVEFDMFAKVVVKGEGQCDLYKFLTSKETDPKFAGDISWNFEKFLINREGEVVARFAPRVSPTDPKVTKAIEEELARK